MRVSGCLFAGVSCLFAHIFAVAAKSSVHSLNSHTFQDFIKQHNLTLAEFYAPWCGHCKTLAPEYEAAAKELAKKSIPLVKVDCTTEADLCLKYGVQGYPTLKIFKGLSSTKPYIGARKSEAIISFMIKQSLPAVSMVTAANIEEFKILDKIVVIGYFNEADKQSNRIFSSVAEGLRDKYLFGGSGDPALAKSQGVEQPSIVLYKDFDEGKDIFDKEFEQEAIQSFIKSSSTPLVGEVGPQTYVEYIMAGIPLAYIFAETPEERRSFASLLKPVARRFKGLVNIATIDADAFGDHAGNLNLDPEIFPAFAIQDTIRNKKFPYNQSKKITEKDISQFIQDVLDEKIEPSVKSEPIPEKQTGPVTVVVAHTYKDIVINNDKDVLLVFYAPWCGHCKALAPRYEELAKIYSEKDVRSSKVTIAKIDATRNDVPDEIEGFPTIKLYPASSKDSPVDYIGSRTVEDLIGFVRDNGKHHVDPYATESSSADTAKASTENILRSSSTGTRDSQSTMRSVEHEEL